MSRKASRLYGRMQNGIKQKKSGVDVLHQRRREIEEREKAKKESGPDKKDKKTASAKKAKKAKK